VRAGWEIRRRSGEWIAGAGGVALPVAMFLDWCSGPSAWQAFSVLDVVLALLRSCRWRLSSSRRRVAARPLPVAFSAFSVVAGAVAALPIVYRIANQPGPNHAVDVQVGAWLGLAAPFWSPRAAGARCAWSPSRACRRHRSRTCRRPLGDGPLRAPPVGGSLEGHKERSCPLSASCCCC
jgi:hypothetical protein